LNGLSTHNDFNKAIALLQANEKQEQRFKIKVE